ncbi:acyl-CoA dehydrogenase family protein [Micrococcus sp. EYE_162]|uniref:acyl-CoA dehydrogenase n=1 Tax=unclassified Micrococcus TaxID=2620948 RepID=UPI002004292C|nr:MULTISPECIES: acyl-CoA dehydrogenase [unclassified Micrococcus]MCK6095423.1 acyl-CoA dehydrogenase family protein [Micrococcus sp. EYE_212]MCK6171498.1 acyl-CoA dehydrogenase family protein [Micrococcus sp. EYE_162]
MTDYATLAARYAASFDAVGRGERAREVGRHLPFAAQQALRESGFGRVGVPEEFGGEGGGAETLLRLLMDLASRDVNTAHLWRSHLVFVSTVLDQAPATARTWLRRVVEGDWAGSALAERSGAAPGKAATLAERDEGGTWVVTGQKYYATGSAFATWTIATVGIEGAGLVSRRNSKRAGGLVREPDRAVAVVRVRQPRVRVRDDWDGFGQRLTATGSVVLDGAAAEELLEVPHGDGPVPVLQEATLLALQAGVGRAALAEGTQLLRDRRRTFNTGTAAVPAQDPQLLEIMGQLAGQQAAAEEMVRAVGRLMDAAQAAGEEGDDDARRTLTREAMVAAYRAQAVVPTAVLDVCTRIFDTLGASATSTALQLDRHWRNARTLAAHDPAAFKVRMAGDWLVNGTAPVAYTSAGDVPDDE